jgi:hypothetical protein
MTTIQTINDRMKANPKLGNIGQWQERHNAAVLSPREGFERAIVTMLRGWLEYADAHHQRYESTITNDGVLGDYWVDIGRAIHGLLDGDCGRIDCGTFSTLIHDTMEANGAERDW